MTLLIEVPFASGRCIGAIRLIVHAWYLAVTALAAREDWHLHNMDVDAAFLNSDISDKRGDLP